MIVTAALGLLLLAGYPSAPGTHRPFDGLGPTGAGGPTGAAPALVAPPVEVLAGRLEVERLGLSAADLVLRLVVANRTAAPLTLRDLTYRAIVEGAPFRAGRVRGPLALPAGATLEVPLPASVGYGEMGGRLLALLARGEVRYRVAGSVRVEGPAGASVERFDESGTVGVTGVKAE